MFCRLADSVPVYCNHLHQHPKFLNCRQSLPYQLTRQGLGVTGKYKGGRKRLRRELALTFETEFATKSPRRVAVGLSDGLEMLGANWKKGFYTTYTLW